jgi:5-methylcytosine-specific restriction endonuclease McrA
LAKSRVPTFKPVSSVPMHGAKRKNTGWRKFINGQPWRRCAKSYLCRNPACVRCLKRGDLVQATNVHHQRGQDMEYAFDESTFEALCSRCHSQQTRQDMNEGKGSDDASNPPERPIGYA